MSNRTSVIVYPPSDYFVAIRHSLVKICEQLVRGKEDPLCMAAILNYMINWVDTKTDNAKQAKVANSAAKAGGAEPTEDEGLWIYASMETIQSDLLNCFGRNKIVDALNTLCHFGLLAKRTNPKYHWDKTLQYWVNVKTIQNMLDSYPDIERIKRLAVEEKDTELNDGEFEIKPSIVENQTLSSFEIKQAIPKNTKSQSKNTSPAATPQGNATSNKPRKQDALFNEIAVRVFGAKLDDSATIKRIGGRVGKIKSYLSEKEVTPQRLRDFVQWYQGKYPDASLPQDDAKFATHYTAFEQSRPVVKASVAPIIEETNPTDYLDTLKQWEI